MNLGKRTFIVLRLDKAGETFQGTLTRPAQFQTSNGVRFSNLTSEVTTEDVVSATVQNDKLRFTTKNPKSNEEPREYEMALSGQDMASIKIVNLPLEPWPFVRVKDPDPRAVFTDWEPRHSYSLDDYVSPSPEMQQLYQEHQRARENMTQFSRAAEAPAPGDAERRSVHPPATYRGSVKDGRRLHACRFHLSVRHNP